MNDTNSRREFLKLAGLGGVVFASGLAGACAGLGPRLGGGGGGGGREDFFFVQLSDTHWGFSGPPNPEAANTLREAVAAVNALPRDPDFVVFTGDLTHTTDDPTERRRRLAEFDSIVSGLRVKRRHFMPGEHDASLDAGQAFSERFGATRYSFDHKGIHFAALDNTSDPDGKLGDAQLDWLAKDLRTLSADAPIVIFTHRPLFDLAPDWDWATKDGSKAIDLLQHYQHVTVFYGHIHQEHHFRTGEIAHHAATSVIFPLPPPHSQPKRAPLPWDPMRPLRGLGFREVRPDAARTGFALAEHSLERSPSAERVVPITARRFEYSPSTVELKVGEPVVLELTALDRKHGFQVPDLHIDATVAPDQPTRIRLVPERAGTFPFHCSVFCGSGHEDMAGQLVVR